MFLINPPRIEKIEVGTRFSTFDCPGDKLSNSGDPDLSHYKIWRLPTGMSGQDSELSINTGLFTFYLITKNVEEVF